MVGNKEGTPHPDSPDADSDQRLMELITQRLLAKFERIGLTAFDVREWGPQAEARHELPFQDFEADLRVFVERNLQLDETLINEALASLYHDYPISFELLERIQPDEIIAREQELKLRRLTLQAWLDPNIYNVEVEAYWIGAAAAIGNFVEAVTSALPENNWDQGYDDINPSAGIERPSEVIRRPSFIDIHKAVPRGITVGEQRYLGFYVPVSSESTASVTDAEDIEWVEVDPDRDLTKEDTQELTLFDWALQAAVEAEPAEENITNVTEPANYLVVADPALGEQCMEWLFLEPQYQTLVDFLLANYLDRCQQIRLANLEEFFGDVALKKEQDLIDELDVLSEQIRRGFWRRLEMYLEFNPYYRIHWVNQRMSAPSQNPGHDLIGSVGDVLASEALPPSTEPVQINDVTTLTFRKLYDGTIVVDVTIGYFGGRVGSTTITKHMPDVTQGESDMYWVFENSNTEIGANPNDELDLDSLNDADLSLNDFVSRFIFPLPDDGRDYGQFIYEAKYITRLLLDTRSVSAFLAVFNQVGIIQEDGSRDKMWSEYYGPKSDRRFLPGMVKPPGESNPNDN